MTGPNASGRITRPFLGIYYRCCRVYGRLWLNALGTAYEGHCPRCLASLRIRVAPGGTAQRFFEAV